MRDNQHQAEAKRSIKAAYEAHDGGMYQIAKAQAEATLSVAHEQRTANLIAFTASGNLNMVERSELCGQIKERLGLA